MLKYISVRVQLGWQANHEDSSFNIHIPLGFGIVA